MSAAGRHGALGPLPPAPQRSGEPSRVAQGPGAEGASGASFWHALCLGLEVSGVPSDGPRRQLRGFASLCHLLAIG